MSWLDSGVHFDIAALGVLVVVLLAWYAARGRHYR